MCLPDIECLPLLSQIQSVALIRSIATASKRTAQPDPASLDMGDKGQAATSFMCPLRFACRRFLNAHLAP